MSFNDDAKWLAAILYELATNPKEGAELLSISVMQDSFTGTGTLIDIKMHVSEKYMMERERVGNVINVGDRYGLHHFVENAKKELNG